MMLPPSAGSHSQRVTGMAASPRPSAVTSARHARSRLYPSPSPPHRRVVTRRRAGARPVARDEQYAPPAPEHRLQALPDLSGGRPGRSHQDDLAAGCASAAPGEALARTGRDCR